MIDAMHASRWPGWRRTAGVLLAAALGSAALGTAIVWLFAAWAQHQVHERSTPSVAAVGVHLAPSGAGTPPAAASDAGSAGVGDLEAAGDAPPEVPPGPPPDGVAIDGAPLYLKCEDELGNVYRRKACGRLEIFEKRFATRLYVVDKCKREVAGDDSSGKLSLGIAIDFQDGSLGFWSGPSSDIPGAAQIASCLRDELAGLPLYGVEHPLARYRMFQTVIFGIGETAGGKPRGRQVRVVMDRVRVREQPVDGTIIGRINTGNEVTLLGRENDWCRVVTPSSRAGWMTCEALDI